MGDFSRRLGSALWRQQSMRSHFLVYRRTAAAIDPAAIDPAAIDPAEIAPNTISYVPEAPAAPVVEQPLLERRFAELLEEL